ncbi:MAG TPA: amidohydrolase family protein, partial [Actinomycetota bacterium]|nr:amidohydrolase family protein [Actinomycetota bacterium]
MAAREAGIRVCLGADWAPSGSKQLLGELKVAHLWNRHPQGLGGAFSDQELCEMVTAHPADALGWGDRIGRVRAGCFADLLALPDRVPDPYGNLIRATEREVRLVLVGGRPTYGTVGMMGAAGAAGAEPLTVAGRRRAIAMLNPAVKDADMTWRQVLAALRAARADPVRAQARQLALAAGEEPLRIIPDDPGG